MSDKNIEKASGQSISLDPENTPKGAMERAFLAEASSPDEKGFDPTADLDAMRNMRQVLENRLKDPSQYLARGAAG